MSWKIPFSHGKNKLPHWFLLTRFLINLDFCAETIQGWNLYEERQYFLHNIRLFDLTSVAKFFYKQTHECENCEKFWKTTEKMVKFIDFREVELRNF